MKKRHMNLYMEMAQTIAKTSYAKRLKVGAIAVRDNRILSMGYNGTPPGTDNNCEEEVVDQIGAVEVPATQTKREVIHAEMNLIYKLARDGESGKHADIFITHSPCFECAKAILSVGFKNVFYRENYRDNAGIDFLEENGVNVKKI